MKKICFVIMPFSGQFDGIWLNVIKPAVEGTGDSCFRVDDFFKVGSILTDILDSIRSADYIIADLTIPNPNVYYELGFSHALGKRVVLLTQDLNTLPFDLKHQRVIVYHDTASGAAKLKSDIVSFISQM